MKAVEKGAQIANETADALVQVVAGTTEIVEKMTSIADGAALQSTAVVQISGGVDQISAVVQNNSATAEQSAAASEELSGQALMMKELMQQFKLGAEEPSYEVFVQKSNVDSDKY